MRLLIVALFSLMSFNAFALIGGVDSKDAQGLRKHIVAVRNVAGGTCSATVIHKRVLLTAAHCFTAPIQYYVSALNPAFLSIRYEIDRVVMHPLYNPARLFNKYPLNDIAIVILKADMPANFSVVDLPTKPATPKEQLHIGGFGLSDPKNPESSLMLRELPLWVVSSSKEFQEISLSPTGLEIKKPGNGICKGDSGGPALRKIADKTEIMGITSWSSGPKTNNSCGIKSMFVDVFSYLTWINATTAKYGFAIKP